MRLIPFLFLLLLPPCAALTNDRIEAVPVERYLEYARSSADWTYERSDSILDHWLKNIDPSSIWGYSPPSSLLEMAGIYAALFDMEGNAKYADRAKKVLREYAGYRKYYPIKMARLRPDYNAGVPPLPDLFKVMRYIRAFEALKRKAALDKADMKIMKKTIEESLDYLLTTQEWGPMNRSALRAETLAWAVRALPDHPKADVWRTYERALGFDNWGNWEIEDATFYNSIWLYSLLGLADAKMEMKKLFNTPEMYYYGQYFTHLICPYGMIPDFGDTYLRSGWEHFIVFFEAAAKAYGDPQIKWAAAIIANNFLDFSKIHQIWLAYVLLDCYRFGSDDLNPERPEELSEEVMEDVVGKKIIFRNGWEPNSTYMLLNYRDEGDGGLIFRDYLRDGIPAEEEKITHGHSDENSVALLMYKGSVALCDGGYRDYMPSGPYGAYRADYFHNRICVRTGKIWMGQKKGEQRYSPNDHPEIPGQSALDFLRNAGSYRPVRTRKVDFLTFSDFDYSRTRLIDEKMGYHWDRAVVYIKDPEMFVVFDIVKATKEGYFTASNLWHTRKILDVGPHWYETQYDSLSSIATSTENSLTIYFPKTHFRIEQTEKERRNYQDEWAISQTAGRHFELGQHIGFVTALIPRPADKKPAPPDDWIRFIDSDKPGDGMALEIDADDKTIRLGIKCNLRMDMTRDHRRPRYTYESGRVKYGKMETNGDFFFAAEEEDKLSFTVVNLSKAVYDGRLLFSQKPSFYGLAFDGGSDQSGVGKARYGRDAIELK